MLDLTTLGGLNSYAYHVGVSGRVVGASDVTDELSPNQHAFLYMSELGMVDLNTLIDPLSGWELLDASEINDAGQITGQGLFGGEYRAYLLSPAPAGDYSGNGTVGPEDYILWKANYGSTENLAADGNGDGQVNAADYTVWRNQLGTAMGAGSGASAYSPGANVAPLSPAVPEPATLTFFIVGLMASLNFRGTAVSRDLARPNLLLQLKQGSV
jgi:probable HAF family extracellular repeat protein